MKKNCKSKTRKKHHYLPRKFLRGFVNEEEGFFIYDRHKDRIFPSNPDSFFLEKHLNTVYLQNGEKSDFLEDIYSDTECTFWPSLDRLRNSTPETTISYHDKLHLFLFLSFLHWRLPCNIDSIKSLSKDHLFKDDSILHFLKLKSSENKAENIENIKDFMRNDPSFQKAAKVITPFTPFFNNKEQIYEQLKCWDFCYTEDSNNWYIVGDNPIISMGIDDHNPLNCLSNIVFPISGNLLLINTYQKRGYHTLKRDFILDYSLAMIDRSQRFVACPNEEFLKSLINLYKLESNPSKPTLLIEKMFRSLNNANCD